MSALSNSAMNEAAKIDPLALAETVLAPLRTLYISDGTGTVCSVKPSAICITPETFDAIVRLPEMVRELREALSGLRSAVQDVLLPMLEKKGPHETWLAEESQWCEAVAKTDAALERSGQ